MYMKIVCTEAQGVTRASPPSASSTGFFSVAYLAIQAFTSAVSFMLVPFPVGTSLKTKTNR
jgi:hypothetical protein